MTKERLCVWIVGIIYMVGVVGTILPATRELVVSLTPLNLLISAGLLVFNHRGFNRGFVVFLVLSVVLGILIEIIGVKSGIIFGNYWYGETLGWKFMEVPVIIGINWFLLSYLCGDLISRASQSPLIRVLTASLLMVGLDFIIEPIAMKLDYWQWEGGVIPIRNYVGWFIMSLLLQSIFVIMKIASKNPLTIPLLIAQVVYFGSLHLCARF